MKPESGKTKTLWTETAELPTFGTLTEDISCDVCVIGGGITGLSTAYMLGQAGKKVVVIDDGRICSGETERTTAHVTNVIDDHYFEIEKMHGKDNAKLAYESQTAAVNAIDVISRREGIDCDFKRLNAYLFLGEGQNKDLLEKELDACIRVGFTGISLSDALPLESPHRKPCLIFSGQAQFHPLKYLAGIARAIVRDGGRIYTQTHAETITDGEQVKVATKDGAVITASYLVVATNSPISDRIKVHTKQAAYRTYVVAGKVPVGSVPPGLYWDTEDPYHYVRLQPTDDPNVEALIIGGEDHKTGQENDAWERWQALERWARKRFPSLREIDYHWSGQVYEPVDGLGYIGRDPAHGENVYVSTGDSGMGMTHGTMTAIILSDIITGKPNPWAALYDPSRKPTGALLDFAAENINVAKQYAGYLAGGDVKSASEIPPGEGAVLKHGMQPCATYRDAAGKICEFSAVCPHAGAIVQWNSAEKSWDCPAHGSRFKPDGTVINGPANRNLQRLDVPGADNIPYTPASEYRTDVDTSPPTS